MHKEKYLLDGSSYPEFHPEKKDSNLLGIF
jgi:hypothetical protein